MKIAIIGTGYVGLVSGVGFASLGHDVTCVDVSSEKVESINSGKSPIYEEGLEPLLKQVIAAGKFSATISYPAIRGADAILVAVGTPSNEDGSINLRYVHAAIESIGMQLRDYGAFVSIIIKSTVVPGTTLSLIPLLERASGKKCGVDFGIGMTPEFLREGTALGDFLSPDRLVLGSVDPQTRLRLNQLHEKFSCPKLETDPTTAEFIKYASNFALPLKISYANELAAIAEKAGVNIDDVMQGVGMDKRIGPAFLKAGIGFGGSCFTKDMLALRTLARQHNIEPGILTATLNLNDRAPLRMLELANDALHSLHRGTLAGKKVAVLGLAFKPGTDDVRDSPSLPLVRALVEANAIVRAFDPQAMENAKRELGQVAMRITFSASIEEAVAGSEIVMLSTDWPEFRAPLKDFVSLMKPPLPLMVDAWRNYSAFEARQAGMAYASIGGPNWNGQDGA